jgi:hypothetical protein
VSTIKVNRIENTSTTDGGVSIDVDGHVTIDGQQLPTAGPLSNRNLIINGAVEVSQRGTGFVDVVDTGPGHYIVDRFKAYHFAGTAGSSVIEHSHSTDAPDGFKHSYLARVKTTGMTASDGYTLLGQNIEGYNINSLDWGSASGKSATLSFWAKSSEIGTFCFAIRNDGSSRSYVKTFDLDDTNWNFVSFTVPAETTGTWNSTNGVGMQLTWGLDVGTNYEGAVETWLTSNAFTASGMTNTWTDTVNNTFQITGVQLEVGSKATPFEHESYSQTLAKCMRYFQYFGQTLASPDGTDDGFMTFANYTSVNAYGGQKFIVPMRARPTFAGNNLNYYANGGVDNSVAVTMIGASYNYGELRVGGISVNQGGAGWLRIEGVDAFISFSAEL